jgi:hypothetical protein
LLARAKNGAAKLYILLTRAGVFVAGLSESIFLSVWCFFLKDLTEGEVHPRDTKFTPGIQSSPLGAKFTPMDCRLKTNGLNVMLFKTDLWGANPEIV